VKDILIRLRGPVIAIVALALSATLVMGAQLPAPTSGAVTAAGDETESPEAGDQETEEPEANETEEPEATETEGTETEGTDEEAGDSADNCLVDPSTLTPEEIAAMSHGSIVCWAAHQTTWPEWFSNHGKFVSCWAHQGKVDAPSCTVAPVAGAATTHGNGHSNGKGKGKGHTNP
jgi:hypothetical protein